jgi:hypothetical protein
VAGDFVRIPKLTSETFVGWLLGDFVPGGSEAGAAASLNTILAARKLEVVAKPSVEVYWLRVAVSAGAMVIKMPGDTAPQTPGTLLPGRVPVASQWRRRRGLALVGMVANWPEMEQKVTKPQVTGLLRGR